MAELLFELGCEEIPAHDLFVLPAELQKLAAKQFEANRLSYTGIETDATPRRLVLVARMEPRQNELREEKIGPPRKVALGPDGSPTNAGLGFARKLGLPFDQLKVVQTPQGEYVAAEVRVPGRSTAEVLIEILPAIVSALPFKKFMKWGDGQFVFGRPIRNLLVLFDGEVVPLTLAGVDAGRSTFGHRFLGKPRIEVEGYSDYLDKLRMNGVILNTKKRVEIIQQGLLSAAAAVPGTLRRDPELLDVMANEVEYPEVLSGAFPASFLQLPQEILVNAMRKHQKYFCAVDGQDRLLPVFFTVLNTRADNPGLIRQGHERVLMARLSDAEFFWHEDLKSSLESRTPLLERLTYHEKLGSYQLKVNRMLSIAVEVLRQLKMTGEEEKIGRLVRLSKTDLVTLMVGEFAELQGSMAGLYGRQEGYPEEHWMALYDQYLPVSTDDRLPRNLAGALLSLIDRVEVLASGYVLNMAPTGSRDPYALRRVATGLMRIILEYSLALDLSAIFDVALSQYTQKTKLTRKEMLQGLRELMEARFRFLMEQGGLRHDYLNAVLSAEKKSFVDAASKVKALWSLRESGDLKTLARCFKRINNIIGNQPDSALEPALLNETAEKRLYQVFSDIESRVLKLIDQRQYLDALQIMVTLGPEIDNFFDEVLVMAEDEKVRRNRIALLQTINRLYRHIADFSELQIEIT